MWCRLADNRARFHYLHDVLAAVRYYPETKTLIGNKPRYLEIWQIERQYGKRLLPMSWPGVYLVDLIFKEKRSISENITLHFLQYLRRMKKFFIQIKNSKGKTESVKYGFHCWKAEVAGQGEIYLPWYDKRRLEIINFQVKPENCNYRITINDAEPLIFAAHQTGLSVNMPVFSSPFIKITIECLDQRNWTLLDFSGELDA